MRESPDQLTIWVNSGLTFFKGWAQAKNLQPMSSLDRIGVFLYTVKFGQDMSLFFLFLFFILSLFLSFILFLKVGLGMDIPRLVNPALRCGSPA